MYTVVRKVNRWFRSATKADVDGLLAKIILSDRQIKIFEMFYIRKQSICYISDILNTSQTVINEELKEIRDKISVIIQ